MKNCVVVGGGISGLLAAIIAADYCQSVTLIESQPQCGGLLQSWQNDDGINFDYGTHILSETDDDELNKIIFKGMYENPDKWSYLDVTKVSATFAGKRFDTGQFVPLTNLSGQQYNNALAELITAPGLELDDAENFEHYARLNYGNTITDDILRPLMNKLQGCDISELHPTAHYFFALNRFIAADTKISRELKQSPMLDAKLAFATYYDGLSGVKRFYPKHDEHNTQGINLWVEHLLAQAREKKVNILTDSLVESLTQDTDEAGKNRITQVTLKQGLTINCDELIWTIPPIFAIRQLGIEYQGQSPQFCPMSLHHMVFDKPFNDKNYYSNIHDLAAKGFRLTLYPNITLGEITGPHRCTVEVLNSGIDDMDELNGILAQELKDLDYLPEDAKLLSADAINVPMGFPRFSNQFVAEKIKQVDLLEQQVDNISLIGKASRREFFVYGILKETHKTVKQLFEDRA